MVAVSDMLEHARTAATRVHDLVRGASRRDMKLRVDQLPSQLGTELRAACAQLNVALGRHGTQEDTHGT